MPTTVVTNNSITVNRIEFNNATNGYVIAAHGNINLVVSAAPLDPTIDVAAGDHEFQLDVKLKNNTIVNVATSSTLEFVNRLNLNGNTLTKTGRHLGD